VELEALWVVAAAAAAARVCRRPEPRTVPDARRPSDSPHGAVVGRAHVRATDRTACAEDPIQRKSPRATSVAHTALYAARCHGRTAFAAATD
jgi:hypothetical protein